MPCDAALLRPRGSAQIDNKECFFEVVICDQRGTIVTFGYLELHRIPRIHANVWVASRRSEDVRDFLGPNPIRREVASCAHLRSLPETLMQCARISEAARVPNLFLAGAGASLHCL